MRPLLILSMCLIPGGCATPLDAPMSPNFGQAVASMNVQIVPHQVSDLPPDSSARRSALAIERYEKGEVKKLETQATSELAIQVVPYGGK